MGKSIKEREIIERKTLILQMLADGRRISSKEIISQWSEVSGKPPLNSKSTITSDITKLKEEGYNIDSNKSGYMLIHDENVMTAELPDEYILPDKYVVKEWIIMHIMQQRYDQYISYEKLKEEIEKRFEEINITDHLLRKCLERLEQLQYIKACGKNEVGTVVSETKKQKESGGLSVPSNKRYYHLTESAPVLSLIHEENLINFFDYSVYEGISTELAEELKKINEKIVQVLPEMDVTEVDVFRTAGRKNQIPDEIKKKLEDFLKLPFKTEELLISYPFDDGLMEIHFMTGIIVYCVEKNELYLLGEADKKQLVLRFDRIKNVTLGNRCKNTVYLNDRYRKMFEESWSVPTDAEDDVEIRFQNVFSVRQFVEDLKKIRGETANVIYPKGDQDDDSWIIYRDKIKGINDFLPHIRSLGSSAVIIKPEYIRKRMMDKTAELIERYKEVLE